ncbi:MAG: MFS transporter [Nitriliruptorales bacterium]|nr:MFS transporter [Nitriliruptorales bacterium]
MVSPGRPTEPADPAHTHAAPPRLRPMVLVGAAVFGISMVAFFRVPLLPSIGRELSMTAADLGLITTAFAVGRLATDIPAGWLADARSARWMLGAAAALLAVGSLVLAAAPTATVVYLAAFLLGVSSAATNTTGSAYFAQVAPAQQRGRSLAGFSAALLGGQAVGPTLGGLFAALGTWRTAQVAGAVLAGMLAATILMPSRAGGRRVPAGTGPSRGIIAGTGPAPPRLGARERAILYLVPFAMFFTLGSMPETLVPIIGADAFNLSAASIGLALGVGGVCRLAGAAIGGVVADRVSRKAALVPGLLLQAVGVALLALRGSVWAWLSAIVVMSLASFGISVANTMLGDRSMGRGMGRQFGAFRFVGDVGLIAGPASAAVVFERFGQTPAVLLVAGLLVATAVAAAYGLTDTHTVSQSPVAGADGQAAGRSAADGGPSG